MIPVSYKNAIDDTINWIGENSLVSFKRLQNGRYVRLKKLGEGGRCIVLKYRDTKYENIFVAIKMLKKRMQDEEAYLRFKTEAEAMRNLNHPNIVGIHDIKSEGGKSFLVLEFVDGDDLRKLMKNSPEGKVDVETILRISIDVCRALQYAHSQERVVLHRDIKPENIMITRKGSAKLMDFGLAGIIGQQESMQKGKIVGTAEYVAPEVARGQDPDARSDLYSLGAVLYEVLSGQPPFQERNRNKVIARHIYDHPVSLAKLNSKVPQALTDCVMKLLEKEPEKRYQSAEELRKKLQDISREFMRKRARENPERVNKSSTGSLSSYSVWVKETPLVDRVEEMNILSEAADTAVQRKGGVVSLCGEAGIGKTRLARELEARVGPHGMKTLKGSCPKLFHLKGVSPYVLWNEVIKDYLKGCSIEQLQRIVGHQPAEVAKLVPELRQKLGPLPQSFPISSKKGQDRLFEAVSQFVTNISREAPLLVVLDNLQWMDQTSLLLLQYLTREINRESILLLCAYRDDEVDEKHPLSPVLTELNRERLLQSIPLKRMSHEETSEMVKRIFEPDDVPEEFFEAIYRKMRGNPFFTEEVIKSLKIEGTIYREENRWKIKELSKIAFPKTVKNVIRSRINRLDNECQNVLTLASFVGNDFSFEALCGVTSIEENKLLEIMEKMLKAGLVKEETVRGEDMYSFADVIDADFLREEVSRLRQKKLHTSVGLALEKVYSDKLDEHFEELAYHFLEGGDKVKALEYFLKAGEKAQSVYAHIEAFAYFQHALGLLEKNGADLQDKAVVLEHLGDIKEVLGEYDACMKYWDDALLLWSKLHEDKKISTLHRKIANVLWENKSDARKAKKHLEASGKILKNEPENAELARLYEDWACLYSSISNLTKALTWAKKALALAQKLDAFEVAACSCIDLASVYRAIGDFEKSREYASRALKTALDNGYEAIAARSYHEVVNSLPFEEHQKRLVYLEKGHAIAEKLGDISMQSDFLSNLAGEYAVRGELDKAVTFARRALALDKKTDCMIYVLRDLQTLGFALQLSGEWDESEQDYREALNIARELGGWRQIADSHFHIGLLHYDREEYKEARKSFENSLKACERAGERTTLMSYSQFLVLTLIELGKTENKKTERRKLFGKATNLLEELHTFSKKMEDKSRRANYRAMKAILLCAQGKSKLEESINLFKKTLLEWDSIRARTWNTYYYARIVLCEYAEALLKRNTEMDIKKANALLDQATAMFVRMGAKKDIERVIAKKAKLSA